MSRRLVLLSTLATLALPSAGLAKEPVKATVCGANGCISSDDREAILPLAEGGPPPIELPTAGSPSYRVRLTVSADDGSKAQQGKTVTFTNWMAPKLRLVRGPGGDWLTMPAATLAALRRVARDIRPFPASRLPLGAPTPPAIGGPLPPEIYAPAPASDPSPASHWTLIGGVAGGVAVAIAAAFAIARRRRPASRTQPTPAS